MQEVAKGLLFVVSAPSATGKTTLAEELVKVAPNLAMSRSYTSRSARPGEVDGVDYNFVSRNKFETMVARKEFLEWADIFGNLYGTKLSDTERQLSRGRDVVLVIDVQGARWIKKSGVETINIFVLPPSFPALEHRLRNRSGTEDTEEQKQQRLKTARKEVMACSEYDYLVVNDDFSRCIEQMKSIVIAERARLRAVERTAAAIIATFKIGE